MARELEIILWKTYSRSKTAHDEWKQNNKQQYGLLKLLFAKHVVATQTRKGDWWLPNANLQLLLIIQEHQGSTQGISSAHVPARYQVSCLHPNPSREEKLTTAWKSELSSSVGWMSLTWQIGLQPMKTLLLKALDCGLSQVLWGTTCS